MINKKFLLLGFLTCAQMAAGDSPKLSLETVLRLKSQKTALSDVRKQLGEPQRVLFSDGEVILEVPSLFTIWEYHKKVMIHHAVGDVEENLPKATISFDTKTGKVLSVNWHVGDDEPEQDLGIAKSHFRAAKFVRREAEQTCAHFFPDEVFFEDRKSDITISWRKTRKEVDSISWGSLSQSRSVAKQKVQKKIDCSIGG